MQASMGWRQPIQMQGIQVTEPEQLGGQALMTVQKLTTVSTLWDIVRGHDFDLVVSAPFVDCSVLPGGQTRLERLAWVRVQHTDIPHNA